jgi:hypothetical protein
LEGLARDPINHRRQAGEIENKLRGKALLLDNPESKRLVKRKNIKCDTNILKSATRKGVDHLALLDLSYERVLPLNRLWEGYMKDLFGITQYEQEMRCLSYTFTVEGPTWRMPW